MIDFTWAGAILKAERACHEAGELFEARKTKAGMLKVAEAQAKLSEVVVLMLEERAK